MDSNTNINYDFMEANTANEHGDDENADLNQIFENSQCGALLASNPGMYTFASGFTPNGMNVDGGMSMGGAFPLNTMFQTGPSDGRLQYELQTSGFPFPQQQVDPAAIVRPQEPNGGQGLEMSQEFSNSQEQAGSMGLSQATDISYEQSEKYEAFTPKPKRTRQSKKKSLTKEQEEAKRNEFLERNRVAASKCRKRKQVQAQQLQDNSQRLAQENIMLRDAVAELQNQKAHLSQILLLHRGCNSPTLEAQIAHLQSMTRNGSMLGSPVVGTLGHAMVASRPGSAHSYDSSHGLPFGSPVMDTLNSGHPSPSWGVYRTESALSYMSGSRPGYKADGTPDLTSPYLSGPELRKIEQQRRARDEEYLKGLEMSRQNSVASNTSEATSSSAATGNDASGYTSATTILDDDNGNHESPPRVISPPQQRQVPSPSGLRRGHPCKSLENLRSPTQQGCPVDPALQASFKFQDPAVGPSLQGLQEVQNPADFLTQ